MCSFPCSGPACATPRRSARTREASYLGRARRGKTRSPVVVVVVVVAAAAAAAA